MRNDVNAFVLSHPLLAVPCPFTGRASALIPRFDRARRKLTAATSRPDIGARKDVATSDNPRRDSNLSAAAKSGRAHRERERERGMGSTRRYAEVHTAGRSRRKSSRMGLYRGDREYW